ncbi:hypothetical protein ILUMI_26021 [Ignelater luminosus]|uniref:2-(3-amino-3-carboxypropyl)histidine synthase n=1 Tax=Ignelater luminosus TaxID=2038154 RepID=A0A8K0C8T2_IGNLU|nr:hypothetical protein ILUMI_26021 [Ignelater luminosus]
MTVPLQFSTNESNAFEKKIDNSTEILHTSQENIDFVYEIDRCTKWIRSNNFQKVCLQFPDFLLPDSTEVAQRLQLALNQTIYVMGDTAYESCCVDYIAAAHVNADAIIHYGPVCFSKPSGSIPSLRIYEKKSLDLNCVKEAYVNSFSDSDETFILLLDTPYILHLDALQELFKDHNNLKIYPIDADDLKVLCSCNIVVIGENRRKIMNLNLSFKPKKLYYYDPKSDLKSIINYEQDMKVLKRRYFLIEKIKDSNTIGIVIGTLAVKNYLRIINRVKKIIQASGRKYYVISVGKPTVAKLANFLELDVYVVITCAMNEIYESSDYYKPIVTPFDIELALNPQTNDLSFSYDYNFYLPDGDISECDLENIKKMDENDVSLITGKVRCSKVEETTERSESVHAKEIALRADGTLAVNTTFGAGFLQERSWKGLEQNLGVEVPELATEGRRGIAQGYQNEK